MERCLKHMSEQRVCNIGERYLGQIHILERVIDSKNKTLMLFCEEPRDNDTSHRFLVRRDIIDGWIIDQTIEYPDGEVGIKNGNEHYQALIKDGFVYKKCKKIYKSCSIIIK